MSMKFNPLNLSLPMLALSVVLSFVVPSGKTISGSGHWEYDDYYQTSFYVYQTEEPAVFEGESGGVAYFRTTRGDIDGEVWGAYVWDSDLQDGDSVVLTFENRVTQSEYERGIECGTTLIDSGEIVGVE